VWSRIQLIPVHALGSWYIHYFQSESNVFMSCEIWSYHVSEDSSQSLLGCDTIQCWSRITTFWKTLLPSSSAWYPELYGITTEKTLTWMFMTYLCHCHDSSGGIALDYGLDDWGSRVRFLVGAGNFSLHHCAQNGSGLPSLLSNGYQVSFPGVKAAGAWSWSHTSWHGA
jgi:hypothetical protein